MKEIKAVIRPGKLSTLSTALRSIPGFPGMTVSKAEGCSAPSRNDPRHTIREELTEFSQKIRVEIIAPDDIAEAIVERILAIAATGHVGDGLVWVTPVERSEFVFKG